MRDENSDMLGKEAAALRALETQAKRVTGLFERAGYLPVDPPILQPAQVFLDRSGENIRRRMYVFTDPDGAELCLRPDLTIPTCRLYLERHPKARNLGQFFYQGTAFRFQTKAPWTAREFTQTGVERIGGEGPCEQIDAEMAALAVQAVREAGLETFEIEMGDLSLFGTLVDQLDVPPAWKARLKRKFWRPDYFRDLLMRLAEETGETAPGDDKKGLFTALEALDTQGAQKFIEDVLELAGIAPIGGRTISEIAERLTDQATDAGTQTMGGEVATLLSDFLAISGTPDACLTQMADLTSRAGISLAHQLGIVARRFEALTKQGVDLSGARFSAGFGRNMEYYTGFVFELRAAGPDGPLNVAGGGRYDSLLESLGAPQAVPAVGCAIAAERLAAAIAEQGGPS